MGGGGGGTRTFLHYIFDNVSRAKPFWKKRTTSRSFRIPYSLRFYTIHNQRTRLASSICNVPLEIQDRTHIRKLLYIVTRRYVFEFTLRILSIVINYQSRVPQSSISFDKDDVLTMIDKYDMMGDLMPIKICPSSSFNKAIDLPSFMTFYSFHKFVTLNFNVNVNPNINPRLNIYPI